VSSVRRKDASRGILSPSTFQGKTGKEKTVESVQIEKGIVLKTKS
jgi:hypothetical protein